MAETERPVEPNEPAVEKRETLDKERRSVEQAMDPEGQAPRESYGKGSGKPPNEQHTRPDTGKPSKPGA